MMPGLAHESSSYHLKGFIPKILNEQNNAKCSVQLALLVIKMLPCVFAERQRKGRKNTCAFILTASFAHDGFNVKLCWFCNSQPGRISFIYKYILCADFESSDRESPFYNLSLWSSLEMTCMQGRNGAFHLTKSQHSRCLEATHQFEDESAICSFTYTFRICWLIHFFTFKFKWNPLEWNPSGKHPSSLVDSIRPRCPACKLQGIEWLCIFKIPNICCLCWQKLDHGGTRGKLLEERERGAGGFKKERETEWGQGVNNKIWITNEWWI